MDIREVDVSEILPLRHAVLRAGLPAESARLEGDTEPGTRHWAAVDDSGAVVGCLTAVPRALDGEPASQLRGMAVAADQQGRGVGARLLRHVEAALARQTPGRLLWCNARVAAIPFYEKHGWKAVSEVFDLPTAGPHRRMVRRIE